MPSTACDSPVKTCPLKMEVLVVTSDENPVINVETTVTFDDGSKYTSLSNNEGIAVFKDTPLDMEGTITFEEEEGMIAKSFAANIFAAIESNNTDVIVQLLQSAVDYSAVKAAYQVNYKGDVGEAIREAFTRKEEVDVIDYLLLKTKLIEDGNITLIEETPGK